MKKNLVVKQDGYKECGVACLLSIIRYYGGNIPISMLLELTNTTKEGTTFLNLKNTAIKFGLTTSSFIVETSKASNITKINMPSICQVIDNGFDHFVVVYKISNKKVIIMDPARGMTKVDINKFCNSWTGYIMTFNKEKNIPYINDEKYLNKIIIQSIIKNKDIILNIAIMSIICTIFSSLYTMYGGLVIDKILETNNNTLLIFTIIFLIILIIKNIASFFRNKLLIYLTQKFDCSIFLNAFQKILLLPHSYYKNRTTGEVVSRINDLAFIKNMLSKIVLTLFLDITVSLITAIILFKISKILFIILIITIFIYIFIFLLFKPIIKKYTNINQENNANINSFFIEVVNGYSTIKNLNLESNINKKMTTLYTKSLNDMFKYESINNLEFSLSEITTNLILLLTYYIGFKLVLKNTLTTGQIIIFTSLLAYFITPIRNIFELNKEYFYSQNSLKRANNLLDIKSVDLKPTTNYFLNGNITIKNLNYSYNSYHNILKNININIKDKEKVLILGKSGSGKSTILKALLKYLEVKRDNIYINKIDINDISIDNLRNNITAISQDEILFTDTIKENILAYQKINDNKFKKVCSLVYVDEFVKRLNQGYNTKLEENGHNISGGERQRIILARALLKASNIYLIDEGLNAIDVNLERKILKNIFSTYPNKTFIIVSHRLENIDLYDKVIEMKNGKVKELEKKRKGAY